MRNAQDLNWDTSITAELTRRHPEKPVRDGIPRPHTNTYMDVWRPTKTTAGTHWDSNRDHFALPPINQRHGNTVAYLRAVGLLTPRNSTYTFTAK